MVIEFGKVRNDYYVPYSTRSSEYVYGQKNKMYTNINELIKDVKSLDDLTENELKNTWGYNNLLVRLTNMANGYIDPSKENSEIKPMPKEVIIAVSDVISKKMPENLSELLQTYQH